jgi:hypothetical protein
MLCWHAAAAQHPSNSLTLMCPCLLQPTTVVLVVRTVTGRILQAWPADSCTDAADIGEARSFQEP